MSTTEIKDDKYWFEYIKKINKRDWIVKIQFFDREKGQWSDLLSPQVGFSETFRQDEETDDASINFKWRSKEKPNLKHFMWVRILHFTKDTPFVATYDENGLPLNHNQYVLGDFQMAQNKDQQSWIVKMSLLEPIERMKYVVGETLAFTNQISKTVTDGDGNTVTYVKDPYNHLTALERFLKVTPANCDNYDEGYDPHQNKSWYNRVKILDKEFLRNIPFDSDSFTEPDFYTILFKYDKTTGRTPCMYFDIDPETDLPRNLERDEYLLKFLRQDGFDKPELKLSEIMEDAQNVVYKSSVANFATGVVSNVENLVTGSNTPYPFYKLYAVPEINENIRDLTGRNTSDSGWGLKVPFPIKRINKIIRRDAYFGSTTGGLSTSYSAFSYDTDITHLCFENQQYNAINLNEYNKDELLHFTEGDDFIFINNYYYKDKISNEDYSSKFYYVEYEPLLNAKLSYGNDEYNTIFNQVDSQIDFNKFNKHLQKYIKSMNKSDLTFTKKHWHFNEIYEVGSRVYDEKENKTYMITGVSYQNFNFELLAIYQLNENHFRRSNTVRASKAIRDNVAIDYTNLKNRKISISKEFCISDSLSESNEQDCKFIFNPFLTHKEKIPQCVLIKILSRLIKNDNEIINYEKYFILPVVSVLENNCMNFIFNFKDNALIGKDKNIREKLWSENPGGTNSNITFRVYCPESQTDVLYTDPFGCVDKLELQLCANPQDLTDIEIENGNVSKEDFEKYVSNYKRLSKVTLDEESINAMNENAIYSYNLNIFKDSLEKPIISLAMRNKNNDIVLTSSYFKAILNNDTIAEPGDGLWFDFYAQTIKEDYETIGIDAVSSCYGGVILSNNKEVNFLYSILDKEKLKLIKSIVIRKNNKEDALIIINNLNKDMLANDFYILRQS